MPRPLPVFTFDRPISVRGRFRPEGAHLCEVGLGYSELRLNVGEVDRLIEGLKAFKAQLAVEDGGPGDRRSESIKALGEF